MDSVLAVKEDLGKVMENGAGVEKPFNLGVLFVHGIGTQTRGQTLTAFGGPFCRWLQDRCEALEESRAQSGVAVEDINSGQQKLETVDWTDALVPEAPPGTVSAECISHRVVLRETKFHDPADSAAPAHTKVAVLSLHSDNRVSKENWLLAESCWADTFSSPSFADLAQWGFGVLPWIVGSHFAAQIRRRIRERPPSPSPSDPEATRARAHLRIWSLTGWIWRLAAAIGGFGFGLLLSAVTMPILALFLVVGLIPIPKLRRALLNVQLRTAATLGDCYVLLARPIEAASIVSEVRRDLLWLSARCSEVVVVAHSQGGAVAHLALRGPIPAEFRLLFTFGSGLRKLEEARQLMKNATSYTRAAVLTSIASLILLLCSTALFWAVVTRAPESGANVVAILFWGVVAAAVCMAGIRDHLRGIPLPELDRWIDRVKTSHLRWIDCYATGDPVPNGVVTTAANDGAAQAQFVAHLSREVCNRSSMLSDHTTYWSNLDQFVSLLYDEIAKSRKHDPVPSLRIEPSHLQQIAKRRRWRVAIGHCIQWVGIAGILTVLVRRSPEAQAFGRWAWSSGSAWLSAIAGIQRANGVVFSVDWTTVGLLILFLVPFGIVRRLWKNWDQAEMKQALGLSVNSWSSALFVLIGLTLLIFIVSQTAYGSSLSGWVLPLFYIVPFTIFNVLEPREKRIKGGATFTIATKADATSVGNLVSMVGGLVSMVGGLAFAAFAPFIVGSAAWSALVLLTAHLSSGNLGGFRPDRVSSGVVGGIAVVVTAVGAILYAVRHRNPAVPPSSHT